MDGSFANRNCMHDAYNQIVRLLIAIITKPVFECFFLILIIDSEIFIEDENLSYNRQRHQCNINGHSKTNRIKFLYSFFPHYYLEKIKIMILRYFVFFLEIFTHKSFNRIKLFFY